MNNFDLTGKKIPHLCIESCRNSYKVFDMAGHVVYEDFYYRYYMDKCKHVYVIPLINVELSSAGKIISATVGYSVEDIVMAAGGNVEMQRKIDACIAMLQDKYIDKTFMTKAWQTDLYQYNRSSFIQHSNEKRSNKYGFHPLPDSSFPLTPTLYTDLTLDQVKRLCEIACESKK